LIKVYKYNVGIAILIRNSIGIAITLMKTHWYWYCQ